MKIVASQILNQNPLLDVGCGSGMISKLIDRNFSYVGIDFNLNYLSSGWKGRDVDGKIAGNVLELPFRSESLKTVLLLHVVEHFPERLQLPLLKETSRVLQSGGRLIISTPNRGTWRNADLFLPPKNPKHFHCLHKNEVEHLLERAGFREPSRHGYDIFLDYPHPLARLIPYNLRKALATRFSRLDKWLIFTASK